MSLVIVIGVALVWIGLALSELRHLRGADVSQHPSRLAKVIHRRLDTQSIGTSRSMLVLVCGTLSWSGLAFIGGWAMVRYPKEGTPPKFIPEQTAPAWLWQIGIGLLVFGACCCFVVLATAPRDEIRPSHESSRLAGAGVTLLFVVATDGPLIAAVVSSNAEYTALPWVIGVMTPIAAIALTWREVSRPRV